MRIITFGTFDLFHVGHLNILKYCKKLGDYLIVGVSSDELNTIKGKQTVIPLVERLEIINNIKYVDEVFIEESMELKSKYILDYKADILVMGDDWKNKFDNMPCRVIYIDRTPNISTTYIKNKIMINTS